MVLKDYSFHVLLFFVSLLLNQTTALADVYKFVDERGRIIYTDEPKSKDYRLLFRTTKKALSSKKVNSNKKKFTPIINKISNKLKLDPSLIHALIRAESSYDPKAVSAKGAVGLMQLMPATAKRYGVNDRRNPVENIEGGARYFRDLLTRFGSEVRLALAAYNAGENAVARYGNKIPPYPETQNYVTKVMAFYHDK